ncbi:KITH protein, partial [Halcyon senegalensis]|nr:KITH protein [Halcyon senegalensis]
MNCLTVPGVHPGSPSRPRGQIQEAAQSPLTAAVSRSTELMRRVRRFQLAQYQCLLVKYAKDTRYSTAGVSTHDRQALPAGLLKDVYQEALRSAVIGIDEGQFFPDIVEFCEMMANAGKTVIVAALDGTFQRKVKRFLSAAAVWDPHRAHPTAAAVLAQAFGSILNLVPLAESVVKLNAVCMECYREASYTKRLGVEREVEVIGGADKYHSVCRACYFRKRPQQSGLENKENMPLGVKQMEVATSQKIFAS